MEVRGAVAGSRDAHVRIIGRADATAGVAAGEFTAPTGVAVAHGRLYVSELVGRRVQVLTLEGAPLQVCATPCYGHRLCVDGAHVWVIVCKEMDAEQQQWLHDGVQYDSEPDIDATTSDMMLLKLV